MNIAAYLHRINYTGSLEPTAETLRDLQVAHLLAVPFENLSIHAGEPIVLDEAALFDKIVRRRRGGFCYELNGLFAALLRALGFDVTLLAAGVARGDGSFGPEFDHLALQVNLEQRWLADAGFGDSFREPLLLDDLGEQLQHGRAYRIAHDGDQRTLLERKPGAEWKPEYQFSLTPYTLADYTAMCQYHQTSPESTFTQRRVCSLATTHGRVTLSDMRLITTIHDDRQERELADTAEYAAVLAEQFGIRMADEPMTS